MDYYVHLAILVGIGLILAQSFNLSFGYGRLMNLAHISSYALGAYAVALGETELKIGLVNSLILGTLICALFALILGALARRLSNDYFAIGTLAFSSLVNALLVNWRELTRGVLGIAGIPRPELFEIDFYDNLNFLWFAWVLAIGVNIVIWLLVCGDFGRALRAIGENPVSSLALGKNVRLYRSASFTLASAGAGLAGGLYAYYINYIDPSSFSLGEMVFVLTIVVLGRPGSFWGVIAATVFLTLLPEPLRFIDMPPSVLGPLRQLLHAVVLFGVVYWKRATIFPVQRSI